MIKKIRIENFRGISDYKEISFVANSKRKVNKIGIKKQNKQEILKVVSLLGKNASGKSSFKEGIDFIQALTNGSLYESHFKHLKTKYERNKKKLEIKSNNIIGSNIIKPKDVMDLILNKEFNNPEKPIKFFIEFIDSKNTIELDITFFENGTLNEKITKNNKIFSNLKKIELKKYSSKIYDNKNLKFKRVEFKTDFWFFDEMFLRNRNWTKIFKNKNINKNKVLKWIRLADNKIIDILWTSKNTIESFKIKHKNFEKEIHAFELSRGTIKWLSLCFDFFESLYIKQSFVVIDELERSFHPSLANFLINIFNDNESNKKSSQLFFTSHSPLIVEEPFRKDAINYIDDFGDIINLGNMKVREDIKITKNFISEKLCSHPSKSDMFEFLESDA